MAITEQSTAALLARAAAMSRFPLVRTCTVSQNSVAECRLLRVSFATELSWAFSAADFVAKSRNCATRRGDLRTLLVQRGAASRGGRRRPVGLRAASASPNASEQKV